MDKFITGFGEEDIQTLLRAAGCSMYSIPKYFGLGLLLLR
jgi:hypothetical protein